MPDRSASGQSRAALRLWRVVPYDPRARRERPGHPLFVPRALQGAGRHDNPALYGCIYATLDPVAAVAEKLAPFRGTGVLDPRMLDRGGRRLALCELRLAAAAELIDLDDPGTLACEGLRPSLVATRRRTVTQRQAADLFSRYPQAAGLRWWSTLEASWICVTLFDRALPHLRAVAAEQLEPEQETTRAAAEALGLAAG
ncbi:RES domain-containing protein [Thermoleophilum album]|uniref:RES domain-containing protein n=1 Tax=Thermoleophilum album TaxID=29539 RepID=UPI000B81C1AB|nr:RES domain-containing protein [Thermoleophilum album]